MIFIGFIFISGIFFLCAFFAGNVLNFYNLDSIIVILLAILVFSIFTFKWKEFVQGIKSMFAFRVNTHERNKKVADHYKSIMIVSIAVGVVSTIQGFISYALNSRDLQETGFTMPFIEAFSYAIFTTAYAIMFSVFLFYPIYILNKEER